MRRKDIQLIIDKKHEGKFVALETPADTSVVACGDDPCEVSRLAAEKGVKEPFIFFVPEADVINVYQLSKCRL